MLDNPSHANPQETLDAVQQLEQAAARYSTNRTTKRLATRTKVLLRSGDAVDRTANDPRGVCQDLSSSGCRVVSSSPPTVGSVYFLEFDRETLDLAPQYARCLRCRLLREDAFEAGFQFFTPVPLPGAEDDAAWDDVL